MAYKQRLLHKQVQKMIMSLKMQQSMHILQMPVIELNQLIAEEMASNPVLEDVSSISKDEASLLERKTPDDLYQESLKAADPESNHLPRIREDLQLGRIDEDNVWHTEFFDKGKISEQIEKHNFQETLITKSQTLSEDLMQQFRLINNPPEYLKIAEQIIGNIADNGYLVSPPEDIAKSLDCPLELIDKVLKQIQSLEPAGVGARDIKECLLLQLKRQGKENSNEALIVENFLNELAGKKYSHISKALKIPLPQIKKYAARIAKLDPKPCRNYSSGALRIIPDVILEKTPDGYEIIINSNYFPRLSINQLYKKMLKVKGCSEEAIKFIREKLKNAQNLISGLSQRQETLKRVTQCIIEHQGDFIEKGISNLKPLTLKEVAEKLQVHPSTISRAVASKYIQTPYGTFALKNFFSQAVSTDEGELSNQKIKAVIEELIKTEPENAPLSDQKIEKILKGKGMNISRRTVTKYRNALKIPPAHLRRK